MAAERLLGVTDGCGGDEADPLEKLVHSQHCGSQGGISVSIYLESLVCQPSFAPGLSGHMDEPLSAQTPDAPGIDPGAIALLAFLIGAEHPAGITSFCSGFLAELVRAAGRPADVINRFAQNPGKNGPRPGYFVSDAAGLVLVALVFPGQGLRAHNVHCEFCQFALSGIGGMRSEMWPDRACDGLQSIPIREKTAGRQRAVVPEDRSAERHEIPLVFDEVERFSFGPRVPRNPGQCIRGSRVMPPNDLRPYRIPAVRLGMGLDLESTGPVDGSEFLAIHEPCRFEGAGGATAVPHAFECWPQAGARVDEVSADEYGSGKAPASEDGGNVNPIVEIAVIEGQNDCVLGSPFFSRHVGLQIPEAYGAEASIGKEINEIGKRLYGFGEMPPGPGMISKTDAVKHHHGHDRVVWEQRHGGFSCVDA